jgi:hypothetical protein
MIFALFQRVGLGCVIYQGFHKEAHDSSPPLGHQRLALIHESLGTTLSYGTSASTTAVIDGELFLLRT